MPAEEVLARDRVQANAPVEATPEGTGGDLPPLGLLRSLAIFGTFAVLLALVVHVLIPRAADRFAAEVVTMWFVVGVLVLFVPLLLVGGMLLRREPTVRGRLRVRSLSGRDWAWTAGVIVLGGGAAALVGYLLGGSDGGLVGREASLKMQPVTPARYWVFGLWAPYWIINVSVEEFTWRGVVLPRQEVAFGGAAWLVNGAGWALVHVAFGWKVLVALLPTLFLIPLAVQRTRNTSVGLVAHAALNLVAFLLVAFRTPP